MSKDECDFFTTKLDKSSHLGSKWQNPLKLLYFIMSLNIISLPYKGGPTKRFEFEV